MQNFIQEGNTINWKNDGGQDVESGDLVRVNDLVGVAVARISNGSIGALGTAGVYFLKKTPGQAMGQGIRVFVEEGLVTVNPIAKDDETPNVTIGVTWAAAATAAPNVKVKINV
jgi:predicted RecA/RadA family phage recombinase